MIPVMDRGGYRWRSPQALPGAVACAFLLACGRWGGHLGIPPIYLTDILLGIAFAHVMLSRILAGSRPRTGAAERTYPGVAVGLLLGWVFLRMLTSGRDLDAARDFAPYGYAVVAFLSASAFARSDPADRIRTIHLFEVALGLHLGWVLAAQLGVAPKLLAIRPDADGTVLAVTGCLLLVRYLRGGKVWRLFGALIAFGSALTMTSRAAALAALSGLLLTLICYARDHDSLRRWLAVIGAAPFVLVALLLVVPHTNAGSKLASGAGLVQADTQIDLSGLGTQRARGATWQRVIDYTRETTIRELTGVVFGPHFMIDSGASVALVRFDADDVSSQHSYIIGTYARLGTVGILLLGLVILSTIAGICRTRRLTGTDDLVFLAVIAPPMIMVEACFGVVLEAPFGAIPFFWFLGVLLANPVQSEHDAPMLANATSRTKSDVSLIHQTHHMDQPSLDTTSTASRVDA
jgi:hypothetical protein